MSDDDVCRGLRLLKTISSTYAAERNDATLRELEEFEGILRHATCITPSDRRRMVTVLSKIHDELESARSVHASVTHMMETLHARWCASTTRRTPLPPLKRKTRSPRRHKSPYAQRLTVRKR